MKLSKLSAITFIMLALVAFSGSNAFISEAADPEVTQLEPLTKELKAINTELLEKNQALIHRAYSSQDLNPKYVNTIIRVYNSANLINSVLMYQTELLFLQTVSKNEYKTAYNSVQSDLLNYSKKQIQSDLKAIKDEAPNISDPIIADLVKSIIELSTRSLKSIDRALSILAKSS